ncbi:putative GTPase, probable translation factor [Caldisphaera lagunensis DSM 15908]|uniref:Putative GTPase, probable translation factor n=1 Tax=Caldisphaera lagunensis (strain DSM 15908 / JCM 11604 / ANMR 0165 / IC-154) TaxID=1056495 RepID=L0A8P5_CALLD|nr:redox-regulated ATPase YchF [Caldisphaera lagunensis]AFZ70243.1 putative GTPase, probable translation factor [Caldisphaera lagunensis DSM 15908]
MEPTNALIGVVGKTNVGKSTFFSAATEIDVPIENRPFVTIEPNVGIGYARKKCVHVELGLPSCNAANSVCRNGERFIPVKLMDVAGLVPGAHQGRGLGNKFLDDLRRADVFLLIVDASGSTSPEGVVSSPGTYDPIEEIKFVITEIDEWIYQSVEKDWDKFLKQYSIGAIKDPLESFSQRLSGFGINKEQVEMALNNLKISYNELFKISKEDLKNLLKEIRRLTKPMVIVANKIDIPESEKNLEKIRNYFKEYPVVPASAAAELFLRKLGKKNAIDYIPGDYDFKIKAGEIDSKTKGILELIKNNIMDKFKGTGVVQSINEALFNSLKLIPVYPVEDINKFTDKKNRVLPDVILIPKGSTAKDLAGKIHTDLANTFLYAINAKNKQRIGANYLLNENDVIKIVAASGKG